MITVSGQKGADFSTITEALEFLERKYKEEQDSWKGEILFLFSGRYEERVTVTVPFLTIIGENRDSTIITGSLHATMYSADIGKLGTFRTYTMMIDTHDVRLINLTVENAAGPGKEKGQAIALFAEGDRLQFENLKLLGHQDTLYTGPLPPKEVEKNGFIGPKQFAPRINGRQYYRDCYIEGEVDFIFGSATAYFESCTIYQKNQNQEINSFATAASTPEGQEYGYVFEACSFIGDAAPSSCYLGRPWRNFAKTVILHSFLGCQLRSEGWHNWGKEAAQETVLYAEYQNYGPGNIPEGRPAWIRYLSNEEAAGYSREKVLFGEDGWSRSFLTSDNKAKAN